MYMYAFGLYYMYMVYMYMYIVQKLHIHVRWTWTESTTNIEGAILYFCIHCTMYWLWCTVHVHVRVLGPKHVHVLSMSHSQVSIFMTHIENYARDHLASVLFRALFEFIQQWTLLELKVGPPLTLGRKYFEIFPEDKNPVWTVSAPLNLIV